MFDMSRYRLQPTPEQEQGLLRHCGHARFVWNLAVEQHAHWRIGRASGPGFSEKCRQLTQARSETPWLREGSVIVQQQALRDFARARASFFAGTHGRPTFRRRGRHEGFRIVGLDTGDVRRVSRRGGCVWVPKVGWLRFRWSRPLPTGVKSYRVTCDRARRWHVAFAHIPAPVPAPDNGKSVGIDRGVVVSAALSTGDLLVVPSLNASEKSRLRRLRRRLARAKPGSTRRARVKRAVARLTAREVDRRTDWVEKISTDLARGFDVIAIEDLKIGNMIRSARGAIDNPGTKVSAKAGLNRVILAAGWGRLARRLEDKACGRVVKVNPAYTSQRCCACGVVDAKARKSQAVFACRSCGFAGNADVNAAVNIERAAGYAVPAREGPRVTGPVHREPQRRRPSAGRSWLASSAPGRGGCQFHVHGASLQPRPKLKSSYPGGLTFFP